MKIRALTILIFLITCSSSFGQDKPVLVDEFEKTTNDDLMARVDALWNNLLHSNSTGVVILSGTSLQKHLYQRRIEGCNSWRRYPRNTLQYIFDNKSALKVQFWTVPKGYDDSRFQTKPFDYALAHLDKPLEITNSAATDEYCPTIFDLEWYANFMNANPSFTGKAVIDTSKRDFLQRVVKYRKKLESLGVKASRVRFLRNHFYHERDEQWWLIPRKKR